MQNPMTEGDKRLAMEHAQYMIAIGAVELGTAIRKGIAGYELAENLEQQLADARGGPGGGTTE